MKKFLDVNASHWAFNEIMDACNTYLEDGEPLMKGAPYQVFESGKPFIYQEFTAGKNQTTFKITGKKITPSSSNPLIVVVDGVQWPYESVGVKGNDTNVNLYTAPKSGTLVAIMSAGVPKMAGSRPYLQSKPYYPHYKLQYWDTYVFYPYWGKYERVTVNGQQLKRAAISPSDLAYGSSGINIPEFDQDMARKYIRDRDDVYIITPSGRIHLPWNYEGVTTQITYAYKTSKNAALVHTNIKTSTGKFKAYVGSPTETKREPYRNDRFFPESDITREEMVISLNRLRQHFLTRFTDKSAPSTILKEQIQAFQGQRIFRLNGTYPVGKGLLKVRKFTTKGATSGGALTLRLNYHYFEMSDNAIMLRMPAEEGYYYDFYFEKTKSFRYSDIGRNAQFYDSKNKKIVTVNGTTDEWVKHALEFEELRTNNGDLLIHGNTINKWYNSSKTIPVVNEYLQPISGNDSKTGAFFIPKKNVSRYEVVRALNRFRIWCIERLK